MCEARFENYPPLRDIDAEGIHCAPAREGAISKVRPHPPVVGAIRQCGSHWVAQTRNGVDRIDKGRESTGGGNLQVVADRIADGVPTQSRRGNSKNVAKGS